MTGQRFLVVVSFLSFMSLSRAAVTLPPTTVQINDRGQIRQFEIARDELGVFNAAREFSSRPIELQSSVETVRQQAAALQQTTGDEVELVLYETESARNDYTRRVLTKQVLVELAPGTDAAAQATASGAADWSAAPVVAGFFIFSTVETGGALALAETLRNQPGVLSAEPLLAKRQRKKLIPNDPLFANQWHLRNTGQGGGTPGVDVNVAGVWDKYQGSGIRIAIVDDGLQYTHPDLAANYDATVSTNINNGNADPAPIVTVDDHGTACAGVAAARGTNALGVTGAAFRASLVGIRLIGNLTLATDVQEAVALAHRNDAIQIKSSSWGPDDDGETLEGPGTLTAAALAQGATTGRGGRGTIFVWAGGNGLDVDDDANYDGYANSIYTIAATAVSDQGNQTDYAEPGACLVVAAPADSAGQQAISTTDLIGENGYNFPGAAGEVADRDYTQLFGGTSSAAPLAAGVVALVLNANPNLGWRDVQEILIRSATKNNAADADWITNAAGFKFNHKYGAGLINAGAAVALATNWSNLGGHSNVFSAQTSLSVAIPDDNAAGVTRSFVISSNVNIRAEHVVVTLSATHSYRGDIIVTLTSPSGTKSRLTEFHDDPNNNYSNWKLMSVRHWGELAAGTWTVNISDGFLFDAAGTLTSIRLDIFGGAGPPPANSADLSVKTAISPDPAFAGDNLTYTLTVKNNGPTNATSVTLTNLLPVGVAFVSANASQGTVTNVSGTVIANIGGLASNGTATVTFTVKTGTSGTLTNVAGAFGSPVDGVPGNEISVTTTTVLPQILNVTAQPRPTSAVITWETRSPAICRIEYGLTTSYGFSQTASSTPATNHSVLLVGLQPGTNYFYRIIATVGGNEFSEGPFSFSTDFDLIVDNPQATYSGTWTLGSSAPDKFGAYYQSAATTMSPSPTAVATYTPNIVLPAKYDVSVWYPAGVNRTTNAQITIFYNTGVTGATANQTTHGGSWQVVATGLDFAAGTGGFAAIGNNTGESGKVVMADAVRWSYTLAQDNTPAGSVPDWWSGYYFGGSVDATLDPDGDGFSTYAEYVTGTDPTNAVSRLELAAQKTATGAQITFSPQLAGRIYQLTAAENLTGSSWSLLTNAPAAGTGEGVFSIPGTGALQHRFYRLAVRLAP